MRARTKTITVLAAVAVVAGIGWCVSYLSSGRLEERIRSGLVAQIRQATGLSCSIEGVQLRPLRAGFAVRGLFIEGKSGFSTLRLSVAEASGSLRLLSILGLRPGLAQLTLIKPHLTLIPGAGGKGLDPEELFNGFRRSLDMAVGSLQVQDGMIETSGSRIPVNFSLEDLACEIRYRPEGPAYQIRLAYRNGRLSWDGRSVLYDLDARGSMSMKGLDFDSIGFRTGRSHLSGEGWMREWKSPTFLFHVAGEVNAPELSVFESHLRDASGGIRVMANLKWDAGGFHTTARYTVPAGSYQGVPASLSQGFMEIKDGILSLTDIRGQLGVGSFETGAYFSLTRAQRAPHRFDIELKQVALRDAARILKLPQIDYENTADGAVHVLWRYGSQDLEVHSDLRLGAPPGTDVAAGRSIALRGTLAFDYERGRWHFPRVDLQSPWTDIYAEGTGGAGYRLRIRTSNLSEPLGIVRGFSESVDKLYEKYPDLPQAAGSYELDGDIGSEGAAGLAYKGAIRVKAARWRSYSLDLLSSNASWNGTDLKLRSIDLHKGAGVVSGDLDMTTRLDEGTLPLTYKGSWSRIPLDWLKDIGVEVGTDLGGVLSGSGTVSNTGEGWTADGQVLVEKGRLRAEPFDTLRARLHLDNQSLRISECEILRALTRVNLDGMARLDTHEMNLRVRLAAFALRTLPAVQENKLEADGQVTGSGEIRGTFENPALKAQLELDGLRYANWELGRGRGAIDLKDRRLQGEATFKSDFGSARFRADISTTEGYRGSAVVDLTDWNAQKLIAGNIPPLFSGVSTALGGRVEIKGPFGTPSLLNYVGEMDGVSFRIRDYALRNNGKILFTIENRRLAVKDAHMVGDGTDLALSGEIPTDGSETMDLRLEGQLGLKLLENLEKRVQAAGSAGLSVRATGGLRAPQIAGQATLSGVRAAWADMPFRFSAIQGRMVFSRNLLRLENIRAAVASGTVQVSGAIEHQDARLRGINLQINARQASFPYPKDFQTTADADLNLRGGPDAQVLAGEIRVTRADYTRSLNLLEQLAGRSVAAQAAQTADPLLAGLRLNVSINSTEGLYVDNELTRLRGGMRLTVRGTPAYPSLIGRVEATSGTIFFRGNQFEIVRASADFVDRNRINPIVEVRAEADVQSYRILLDIGGDLDHLRINVTSDPPLSTVDILSMLTTGKSIGSGTETSRRQTEITGLSAASILSEGLTGVLGKRVQRIFGLQTFRVDPFLAGAENDPTARVTISERLSRDLNITFSRNLSTNEEQIVIVEYQINRSLSVVATRDENGKYGIDFRFRRRFH